ncbi:MAG: DNRLRE domain-containing protein [Thermoanaerobacteraceae bacterium]|nr:DNRLRE domain-containing protein [Thermoanaerobacteraceae bacterium]
MPTIVIQPSAKDASLESGYPTTNTGSDKNLWIGRYFIGFSGNSVYRALVQFDVSSIPAGSTVTNAILRLYIGLVTNSSIAANITPYLVTGVWDENTVTWNTAPAVNMSVFGTISAVTGPGWYEWNITNIVNGWVNGVYANNGVMLRTPETQNFETKNFFSREESVNLSLRPMLITSYEVSILVSLNDRRFAKTKTTYTTYDMMNFTNVNSSSAYSMMTYFVNNTGANPALLQLQISPGDDVWLNDGDSIVIQPGETKALVPFIYSQYTRLSYKNTNPGNSTTITVWYEAQV